MYVFFFTLIDLRVENWFMMSSPIPSFVICFAYIVFVKMGPWLMKDRKPFNIRNILLFYNFAMVLLSTYCFLEVSAKDVSSQILLLMNVA